jgi:hypothetical protein
MDDKERNKVEKKFAEIYKRLNDLRTETKNWKMDIASNSFNFEEQLNNLYDHLEGVEEELDVLESIDNLPFLQRTIQGLDQEEGTLIEENEKLTETIKNQRELIFELVECLERENMQDHYRFVVKPSFDSLENSFDFLRI